MATPEQMAARINLWQGLQAKAKVRYDREVARRPDLYGVKEYKIRSRERVRYSAIPPGEGDKSDGKRS